MLTIYSYLFLTTTLATTATSEFKLQKNALDHNVAHQPLALTSASINEDEQKHNNFNFFYSYSLNHLKKSRGL
jgi:hypothetical protein